MNIYRQELRMLFKSVAMWSAAVAAVLVVFVSMFSSYSAQTATLNDVVSNFPPQLLAAFGLTGVDLSSPLGYFGFIFLFVQICLAIQASNYGFSMVSVEEREWTADFLLTKPVNRSSILSAKLLAALTGLTVTNLVVWIVSFISLSAFTSNQNYDAVTLALVLTSIVFFQLFFLSVGLAVSVVVKRIRSVIAYAMGLGFGMYVLSVFGDLLGTSVLERITPFRHFDPRYIIQHRTYDLPLVAVSIVLTVVAIIVSYALYTDRDIPAVA